MQGVTAGAPGQQLKDHAASRHPGALTSGLAAPSGTHELLAARQLQPTRALYLQFHPDPPQGEVGLATAGVGMLLQLHGDRRSAIRRHGLGLREALIQEWYNGREALIADGVAGATRFKNGLRL